MQDSFLTQVLFLYLPFGLIFYFLIFLPQRKKQKELKNMLENLKKNDEVVTSSSIHGTVVIVKEKTVVVRGDENCRIEFDKEAIISVKANPNAVDKPEVVK
jgi:preprotein translocase subunit YajC